MKITITIDTDSDAFTTNPNELRDILRSCATKINAYGLNADQKKCIDSNGNEVGSIKVTQ